MEPAGERWLRPGLRKYSCPLTFDTNTVNRRLKLSDNNRKVTLVEELQEYPDHPDRFDEWSQLLCNEGLAGRCYWEAEWSGEVDVSVNPNTIRGTRDDADGPNGWIDQSCWLGCSETGYFVGQNGKRTLISFLSSSSVFNRVAVYVDCPAGTLSFYRVSSDTLIHLHTFNTTFTEPLYAGFGFWSNDSYVSLDAL